VIEPQMACISQLKRNYSETKNVTILKLAVSDKQGSTSLSICEEAPTISTISDKWIKNSRFSNEYQWTKKEIVETTTLDILIKKYGEPSFCKIDVEGAENLVITGLSKPIKYMSFEFTNEFIQDAKKSINHLKRIGYKDFNLSLEESMILFIKDEWIDEEELIKILDQFEDPLLWGDIYARYQQCSNS
jgi:FkbM family methyltransferase